MTRVALVLLAAGQSRRFGSDKLRLLWDGEPMLSRTLRRYCEEPLMNAFVSRTVVLSDARADFAAEAERLGWRVVFNPHPEDGQSQSVRLGVRDAMRFSPDGVLCSVADQPNLGAKTVLRILNAFEENRTRIVRPAANGRMGNPVLFPNDLFEPLCALTGDVGGSAVIRQHSERVLTVETTEEELKDVDRETEAQT